MFDHQFNSDNWHRDATSLARRNAIRTRRWGMRVTVYQGVDAGDYVLSYGLASTQLQDNNNWLLVANIGATWGGGGGVNIYNSDGVVTDPFRSIDGNLSEIDFVNFSRINFEADNTIDFDADVSASMNAGTVGNNSGVTLNNTDGIALGTDFNIDFNPSGDFLLKGLTATDPITQFFAGDGEWRYALGQALDATVTNPTAGEDGYVIAWNDGNQEYELVPSSGGALTFENGTEEISPGVVGLGSPLTQNTLIDGDSFSLQFGTFLTSPLASFAMYSEGAVFLSVRHPVSGLGSSLGLGADGGAALGVSSGPIVVQNVSAIGTAGNDLIRALRLSSNTNDTGVIASWTANTSGAAAAGLGMAFTYVIENSTGGQPEAGREVYSWATPTDGAEYASFLQRLRVNGAMADVISITTNSTAPNIFTTLSGQLILPNLPAADPGVPGYLYHTAGAVMVSL